MRQPPTRARGIETASPRGAGVARTVGRGVLAIAALGLGGPIGAGASAQQQRLGETGNPTAPQPVISPGGHTGEIWALDFLESKAEGLLLFSAGLDKVVHVWTVANGPVDAPPGLSRTIRPPIFRGRGGAIYAMDLSPADAEGHRLLAVGGYGVQASRGELVLFRVPGRADRPTGDVAAVLPEGYRQPEYDLGGPSGHFNAVTAIRFHPRTPKCLASGSLDGTVRLWTLNDLARPRTFVTLRGREPVVDPAALLADSGETVDELAFTPDGSRLVVCVRVEDAQGGTRGLVRVWDLADLARPRLAFEVANHRRDGRPAGAWVNPRGLAISPDGRWVFLGQENGLIVRYELDPRGQLVNPAFLPTGDARGPVEALACGMTGSGPRLLSSVIGRRHDDPTAAPPLACDIDLWPVPGPEAPAGLPAPVGGPSRIGRTDGRVRALAFSPDGSIAAFAGGDAQGVYLRNLSRPIANVDEPDVALEGKGSSIWDVRFRADSGAIGFSRVRPGVGDPPVVFEGFELAADFEADQDRMIDLDPEGLVGIGTTSSDGKLEILPRTPATGRELSVIEVATGRERCVIRLDATRDYRWWCYGFIPPGEGHPSEVVAVGTEGGVAVFGLADGGEVCPRVRELDGHSGPVFSIAPSPDGRWLATGSGDQTVQLWPMEGIDRVPALGATLLPPPDPGGEVRWLVSEIRPGSFAEQMGMKVGDRIADVQADMPAPIDPAGLDALAPGQAIHFIAYRQNPGTGAFDQRIGESLGSGYMTRKRDRPALTLFPSVDREWIAWTPQGYYQSSILGDSEYLAWHRNRSSRGGETTTDPFDAFAADLRRPDVLDALVESADPGVASRRAVEGQKAGRREDASALAEFGPPPMPEVDATIAGARTSAAGPVALAGGDSIPLELRVEAADDGPGEFGLKGPAIRAIEVLVNSRVAFRRRFDEAITTMSLRGEEAITLPIDPGLNAVSVVVEDEQGRRVRRGPSVAVLGEVEEPGDPRLRVLTIGIEGLDGPGFPEIAHAGRDAEQLGLFLEAPNGRRRFEQTARRTLRDGEADADSVESEVRSLVEPAPAGDGANRDLGRGDSVFVFVNSHFVDVEGLGPGLLSAGKMGEEAPRPVSAALLSDVLGTLAGYGCKVVVLLDLHHDPHPGSFRRQALNDWVRDGLVERGVIVCLASNSGPSGYVGVQGGGARVEHGAFALGLLRLFDNPDAIPARLRQGAGKGAWTLLDFQRALAANVRSSSRNKRQTIGFYRPRSIDPRTPIFDPPSPIDDRLAGLGAE